ncbi:phosphoribosylglycinamide formyltransferase [Ferrimonas lipolytica]|uniref:Phosphoribosylglycinamide formyltransferase n=1 Tax=Ferrimonas lipolytica TaxID=2724191 RepID=A0A6H1UEQ1_9GAMM|nr:phosphoribosylglycinamide formyltransferase [Ferrimonas lipolytica]QIZ77308.1 phosphoribosylglycinamide formyltransferase [Ferrimonas lipolytica]
MSSLVVMVPFARTPSTANGMRRCHNRNGALKQYQQYQADYQQLCQLPTFEPKTALQPDLPLPQLHQLAFEAQQELAEALTSLIKGNCCVLVNPGVKSFQRAQGKIETELQGNIRRLTDLARATLVVTNLSTLVATFAALAERVEIVSLLNRFQRPKANGYRDLKALVRLSATGMLAEVQLHLEAIQTVKNGEEHRAYQQLQCIQRKAELECRPLSVWEQAKVARLRRYSRALYEEAWQRYVVSDTQIALS